MRWWKWRWWKWRWWKWRGWTWRRERWRRRQVRQGGPSQWGRRRKLDDGRDLHRPLRAKRPDRRVLPWVRVHRARGVNRRRNDAQREPQLQFDGGVAAEVPARPASGLSVRHGRDLFEPRGVPAGRGRSHGRMHRDIGLHL